MSDTPTPSFLDLTAFSDGGNLFDDVDAVLVRCRFGVKEGIAGEKAANPGKEYKLFGLFADFKGTKEDGSSYDINQFYFLGKPENYEAINEGRSVKPLGKATNIHRNSEPGLFLANAMNAGVPKTRLATGDVSQLEGATYHLNQIPHPDKNANQGKGKTVLVPTRVVSAPWDGATATQPAAAATVTVADPETVARALTAAKEVLGGATNNTLHKDELARLAFQKQSAGANVGQKKAVIELLKKDDFLNQNFAYDGGTGTVTAI